MTQRQSATILVLLTALYVAFLALLPPQLEFTSDTIIQWLSGIVTGVVIAVPTFLALWSVHGSSRAAVRLPLTAWLLVLFFLATTYGEVRYFGHGDADIVLLAVVAWLVAHVAILLLLWLLRTVRGWRLRRLESDPVSAAAGDPSQSAVTARSRQFTIRTVLEWTSAAAVLCAGFCWLAPYANFDIEESVEMLLSEAALIYGALLGLGCALAGLPVLSAAWIVLADGSRPVWRSVLATITILGIAGGTAVFRWWFDREDLDLVGLALTIEVGVITAALIAVSIVRACGYRLVRPGKEATVPIVADLVGARPRQRAFAFTLTSLVIASVLLACYAPLRLETWRQADETNRWASLGFSVSFDGAGHVTSATSTSKRDLTGLGTLISQLPHLTLLQLSHSTLNDALLGQLPSLPELETLLLAGTAISDAGLSQLDRFPNLKTLSLSNTGITDAGLSHLGNLSKLTDLYLVDTAVLLESVPTLPAVQDLNLKGTSVGDASMSRLGHFPNLTKLSLEHTNVTDVGLEGLNALKALKTLDLKLTDVSDEGVTALSQLHQLQSLDLRLTAVSKAGFRELHKALPETAVSVGANDETIDRLLFRFAVRVESLGAFGNVTNVRGKQTATLKKLHLRGGFSTKSQQRQSDGGIAEMNSVTDAGMAFLSGQTAMEELDLRDSGITDAGLASLVKLTNLKRLDLRGTRVTDDGCARMAKSLRDCVILR
ncbi:MAG TPA: hypothetical protein VHC22_25585 [Pirellulales bacterium]|nr:hypothetical protein [Pirellulales bacterium]